MCSRMYSAVSSIKYHMSAAYFTTLSWDTVLWPPMTHSSATCPKPCTACNVAGPSLLAYISGALPLPCMRSWAIAHSHASRKGHALPLLTSHRCLQAKQALPDFGQVLAVGNLQAIIQGIGTHNAAIGICECHATRTAQHREIVSAGRMTMAETQVTLPSLLLTCLHLLSSSVDTSQQACIRPLMHPDNLRH